MKKKYSCSLFIFRRDLRLFDNTALLRALENSQEVIVCFIFDPEQITAKNHYKSDNALQFMLESLVDLQKQLVKNHGHLYLLHGKPDSTILELYKKKKFDAVFINNDYTPYSKKRDLSIKQLCNKLSLDFYNFDDLLLNAPGSIKSKAGKPYTIFTPYWRAAILQPIAQPQENRYKNYCTEPLLAEYNPQEALSHYNPDILVHGGRNNGLTILKHCEQFENYPTSRDFPHLKTTHLSAHNKFGTISIREEFYYFKNCLGVNHTLIKQLYWRDFYTQIAAFFPHIFGNNFLEKYKNISWENDTQQFQKWCTGTTGFPIVDAGMRQLNKTGWMHNRVRMIVASFLTKDLQIDWRWGEKYFAQKLVDYDPAVNNGNWQWAASTGCDPQPYFRIFNPWLQQKKFDPECVYIKQWVPELADIPPKIIHAWYKVSTTLSDYPEPMVDHTQQSILAKKMFSRSNL